MDMNDILNQWDSLKKEENLKKKKSSKNQVSHKKANAPTLEEKEISKAKTKDPYFEENHKQMNPMELWLRRYGTIDKDKMIEETEERRKQNDRNFLREMRFEAKIDLHGLHQDEAEQKLQWFVTDCKRRGLKKILIVHGKGIHSNGSDPVLGELVRRFIEHDKRLGLSGHPDRNNGGNGATWVIIK